jgi:hypothetical protein
MNPILLLDPSSHHHNNQVENLGDLIIRHHIESLLEQEFKLDTLWVPYDYSFTQHDRIVVAGANVVGEYFSSPKSAVWHPPVLKILAHTPKAVIPIGVGWHTYQHGPSWLTRFYYKKLINISSPVSVRDGYTLNRFRHMNYNNVFLTGCPSMYNHVPISTSIPKDVLFTLTNYRKDFNRDMFLLKTLAQKFDKLYFFPQGATDLSYLHSLIQDSAILLERIEVLNRSLADLEIFLENVRVVHIGTRLHMTMHLLSKQVPSICLEIDNRAIEMKKSFPNLPIFNILELVSYLKSSSSSFEYLIEPNIKKHFSEFIALAQESMLHV